VPFIKKYSDEFVYNVYVY